MGYLDDKFRHDSEVRMRKQGLVGVLLGAALLALAASFWLDYLRTLVAFTGLALVGVSFYVLLWQLVIYVDKFKEKYPGG